MQKSNIHSGPNSKLALKIQTLSRLGLLNILGMYAKKKEKFSIFAERGGDITELSLPGEFEPQTMFTKV